MKIKLLKATYIKGEYVEVGQVVDAPENDAQYLIGMGKAVSTQDDIKKAEPEPKSEPVKKKKKLFTR